MNSFVIYILLFLLDIFFIKNLIKKFNNRFLKISIVIIFFISFLISPWWKLDKSRIENNYIYKLSKNEIFNDVSRNLIANKYLTKTLALTYFLSSKNNIKYLGIPDSK